MKNDERQVLKIIKYTPPIFIIVVSIFITLVMYFDYKKTLEQEKESIRNSFITQQKTIIEQEVTTAFNFIQREFNSKENRLKKQLKKS